MLHIAWSVCVSLFVGHDCNLCKNGWIDWAAIWGVDLAQGAQILPRDAMLSAVYAVVICPSLCVCVCLSHSGIVSKRLNVGSQNNATRYIGNSIFLTPKITAKFERGHPLRGRQMYVGWVKISHFWRKTRYNSKTVQDRWIVSNRKSYMLYQIIMLPMTLDDP